MLSGNRNFEARIHGEVKANYLASPPLVVAYALAGRMDIDLVNEPIAGRRDVYLARHLADARGDRRTIAGSVEGEMFTRTYADVYTGDERWRALDVPAGDLFAWEPDSTYVRRPPYFDGMPAEPATVDDIVGARCLVVARRLGHHRPHLARRRDPARLAGRASTSSSTASSGGTSTRTARGGAITR